ncbi:alanine dehydrogenase, partial [Anaerosalibacter bizertensis]|nr:alanine dehydrogenase [Anaerosalibacter bizertensis]
KHDVVHYAVANIPGAVPKTSTLALTNATLPYAIRIANKGWKQALKDEMPLRKGANILEGKLVYKAVADAFDLPYTPVEEILG